VLKRGAETLGRRDAEPLRRPEVEVVLHAAVREPKVHDGVELLRERRLRRVAEQARLPEVEELQGSRSAGL
jgi:hypothetical protein